MGRAIYLIDCQHTPQLLRSARVPSSKPTKPILQFPYQSKVRQDHHQYLL